MSQVSLFDGLSVRLVMYGVPKYFHYILVINFQDKSRKEEFYVHVH